jgi:CRISPR-associated protein (TIGR03986 family)
MKGTIVSWSRRAKNGRIKPDDKESELNFSISDVTNVDKTRPDLIKKGIQVTFDLDDKRARNVAIELPAQPISIPDPLTGEHTGYFLNPYNFVRNLVHSRPDHHILGNCPPPPHDRYIGMSGRITCQVTAVTPLFISDSHKITKTAVKDAQGKQIKDTKGNPKMHASYQFFTVTDQDGKTHYALPGSSLRGMVRSIFELVTNSCFSIFDGDRRLESREEPKYGNKVKGNAGIIRRLATKDEEGEIELCYRAEVGAYYTKPDELSKNAIHSKASITDWHSGDRVYARVYITKGRRYIVKEFDETKTKLQKCGEYEKCVEGWLKITGCGEDTSKKSEALFLDPAIISSKGKFTFTNKQQIEYNSILAGQVERGQLPIALSQKTLEVGDLVWLEMDENGVKRLVRVQIPRTPYPHPLADFLRGEHLHHCAEYDHLCPACRVFGWTYQAKPDEKTPQEKKTAYQGRVRFSHAQLINEAKPYQDITLAILASPKPTKTHFYLLNRNGQLSESASYKSKNQAQLRGRKVYRHFWQANAQEFVRAPRTDPQHDDQNRTVRNALSPGATFQFTLDFENLTPLELGALLWALELPDGMHHRLGYAKPLGFGSVTVKVAKIAIINWTDRLTSLDKTAISWLDALHCAKTWQTEFATKMKEMYGDSYATLLNELKALLSESAHNVPIHYPRLEEKPNPEGKNFEWFQKHKNQVLGLALEDEKLPL